MWAPPPQGCVPQRRRIYRRRRASFEARLQLAPQDEAVVHQRPHPEAPAQRASKDARLFGLALSLRW
ncbi:hypothetical protein CFHF_13295 [Caulobacter flavus]|uniref:Uncharacterized protein n=1 Tax=Caulobacter flavus TaxID=1679497 RepID=A0A2N5CSU3_9CAUL|nr:hypothetical protein C1707_15920 [Caulobacter flavus]PLR14323.1 hypothetical protein CFHF_13295 [Caulobacter flavus]